MGKYSFLCKRIRISSRIIYFNQKFRSLTHIIYNRKLRMLYVSKIPWLNQITKTQISPEPLNIFYNVFLFHDEFTAKKQEANFFDQAVIFFFAYFQNCYRDFYNRKSPFLRISSALVLVCSTSIVRL